MTKTDKIAAVGVQWDLPDLFAGADDPKIDETLDASKKDAEAFALYRRTP